MRVLLVAEHEGGALRRSSRSALSLARSLASGPPTCLVLGAGLDELAREAARYAPTLVADHPALAAPLAGPQARVIAEAVRARGADLVVAASTSWAKDTLTRAAGELGGALASDVIACRAEGAELILRRPMFAGSVMATVRLRGRPGILTVRESAFDLATPAPHAFEVMTVDVSAMDLPGGAQHHGLMTPGGTRPSLCEARVVVSGGGAFGRPQDFERLVGGLADACAGAAACSRAAVDTGAASSDLQVGQTGKVVAPELYVALGLSGAVQHVGGMRGSRCVVAVNTDPHAPILEVADLALIGDVFEVVPRLIEAVQRLRAGSRRDG